MMTKARKVMVFVFGTMGLGHVVFAFFAMYVLSGGAWWGLAMAMVISVLIEARKPRP